MEEKNKGFTLIELLAVIVILALIALIATPIILNVINDAKKQAAKDSAYGYIDAVEKYIVLAKTQAGNYKLDLVPTEEQTLTCETKKTCEKDTGLIGEVNKKLKGTKPNKIKLIIKGSEVASGTEITVNGYTFIYDGKKLSLTGKTTEEEKTYTVYANGTEIYYNLETGKKCNKEDAVSTTGTKSGCMKWYAFNDEEENAIVNVILDHNITAKVAYNSTKNNSEMKEVKTALEKDTGSWKSELNARLITANEIAEITGNKSFDVNKENQDWFCLDTNEKDTTNYCSKKEGTSEHAWLFDYTYSCTIRGCNKSDSSNYGYWTNTRYIGSTTHAWVVSRFGFLHEFGVSDVDYGVRPVITISKSNI